MKANPLTRLLAVALTAICCMAAPARAAAPQAPRWETVETVVADLSDERLDVTVHDQYIYVFTPRPISIKLYTILGQPVSQGSIPAGTSRIKLAARGIYILKAGDVTRRITI